MTLAEAEEIFAYWDRHPPPYQMISIIAQMLGWKASESGRSSVSARRASGSVDPSALMLAGVFSPADESVVREFSDLARLATSGSA